MKFAELFKYEIKPRHAGVFPLNWEAVFHRSSRLGLEIGFGNGEFLVEWARQNPEWNFVGIELSLESMERALKRIQGEGLTNIRLIRDNARFAVRELFGAETLDYVIMNFPDPWPKERHRHRRTLDPVFIRILSNVLKNGATFELTTDQGWYAENTRELFQASGSFELLEFCKNPRRPVSTKYERKWLKLKRDIFNLKVVKRKSQQVERIVEGGPMPHFVIHEKIESSSVFNLKDFLHKEEQKVFAVKGVFAGPEKDLFLLKIVSTDDDYTQTFYLIIAPRSDGYIVKIDQGVQPYRTPAVKMAVRKIGEKLLEQAK